MNLTARHLADLRASGLTDETIRQAGLYSESNSARLARILNWERSAKLGSGLVIRFADPVTGELNGFARVKPDKPRKKKNKNGELKPVKYEQPAGAGLRAYFPPLAVEAAKRPGEKLIIVEGEKKALAGCQTGLATIGLTGVWAWQRPREKNKSGKPIGERLLIDDLDWIDWQRPIAIAFDFDSRSNSSVNHAQAELAPIISERGADVSFIQFPPGPRDSSGIPGKMALDDYLVAYGGDALRQLVADQTQRPEQTQSIDDYREAMQNARIDSLNLPGVVNFDSSPTGSGKTHADLQALQSVKTSLVILPVHSACREFESDCQSRNIPAVAYPRIDRKTCENYDVAEKALDSGLSVSQAICPTCQFNFGCTYQAILAEADSSPHRIATHHRGALSFEQLAQGREYISIHEDCSDFLRPGFTLSTGFESVAKVFDEAVTIAIKRRRPGSTDRSEEWFFRRGYKTTMEIIKNLTGGRGTAAIELPTAAAMQPSCDKRLFDAMENLNVWPIGDAVQLVKLLTAGEIVELVIREDEVFTTGGKKLIRRSICGFKQTKLSSEAVVWISDATADHPDVEALAGRPVRDRTPSAKLENKQPLLQIPMDITKRTTRKKVVGIVRSMLNHLAYNRIGIITHREHVAAIDRTARKGEILDSDSRGRIARVEYFRGGESRGSNEWLAECDCLIILGTPRVPPAAIKTRLIQLGLPAAAARGDEWVSWGRDYWSAVTTSGLRQTVKTLAYRDHDWQRAHRAIVRAELIQAAGRGRAVTESGIPTIVVTTENLGLKILDFDFSPLTDFQSEVVFAMERLSVVSAKGLDAKLSEVSPNRYLLGNTTVKSTEIAASLNKSDGYIREVLRKLAERGLVKKVGERRGWILLQPPTIDLYAAAGIQRTAVVDDFFGTLEIDF